MEKIKNTYRVEAVTSFGIGYKDFANYKEACKYFKSLSDNLILNPDNYHNLGLYVYDMEF